MDAMQFQIFMKAFQDIMKAFAMEKGKGSASSSSSSGLGSATAALPRISVKISVFKGEPGENVEV